MSLVFLPHDKSGKYFVLSACKFEDYKIVIWKSGPYVFICDEKLNIYDILTSGASIHENIDSFAFCHMSGQIALGFINRIEIFAITFIKNDLKMIPRWKLQEKLSVTSAIGSIVFINHQTFIALGDSFALWSKENSWTCQYSQKLPFKVISAVISSDCRYIATLCDRNSYKGNYFVRIISIPAEPYSSPFLCDILKYVGKNISLGSSNLIFPLTLANCRLFSEPIEIKWEIDPKSRSNSEILVISTVDGSEYAYEENSFCDFRLLYCKKKESTKKYFFFQNNGWNSMKIESISKVISNNPLEYKMLESSILNFNQNRFKCYYRTSCPVISTMCKNNLGVQQIHKKSVKNANLIATCSRSDNFCISNENHTQIVSSSSSEVLLELHSQSLSLKSSEVYPDVYFSVYKNPANRMYILAKLYPGSIEFIYSSKQALSIIGQRWNGDVVFLDDSRRIFINSNPIGVFIDYIPKTARIISSKIKEVDILILECKSGIFRVYLLQPEQGLSLLFELPERMSKHTFVSSTGQIAFLHDNSHNSSTLRIACLNPISIKSFCTVDIDLVPHSHECFSNIFGMCWGSKRDLYVVNGEMMTWYIPFLNNTGMEYWLIAGYLRLPHHLANLNPRSFTMSCSLSFVWLKLDNCIFKISLDNILKIPCNEIYSLERKLQKIAIGFSQKFNDPHCDFLNRIQISDCIQELLNMKNGSGKRIENHLDRMRKITFLYNNEQSALDYCGTVFLAIIILTYQSPFKFFETFGIEYFAAEYSDASEILICKTKELLKSFSNASFFSYQDFCNLRYYVWVKSHTRLTQLIEEVARNTFILEKNISLASILYIIIGKPQLLSHLWKSNNGRLSQFFKNQSHFSEFDYSICLKNAYCSLSKQKYYMSIMFFLLAGHYNDAVQISIERLQDFHISILILKYLCPDGMNDIDLQNLPIGVSVTLIKKSRKFRMEYLIQTWLKKWKHSNLPSLPIPLLACHLNGNKTRDLSHETQAHILQCLCSNSFFDFEFPFTSQDPRMLFLEVLHDQMKSVWS